MRFLRVATWVVALIFSLSSLCLAAEVTYSGIPGKWQRGTKKGAKAAASEEKTGPKDKGAKKIIDDDKLKVTVGPKKG